MSKSNKGIESLFEIKGEVAIVTGASGRLGRINSQTLASKGAKLAICARRLGPLKALSKLLRDKYGVEVFEMSVDLTKEAQVRNFFKAVYRKFKRIDILVNNAGISGSTLMSGKKSFSALTTSEKLWNNIIKINLSSVFFVTREAAKYMIKHKHGKIINISSVYGLFIDNVNAIPLAAYDASKGGLLTLTRELAVEFAQNGICVNALAPSYIITGKLVEKGNKVLRHWINQTPMKRLGQPEDLEGALLFLASPASDFVTGEVIAIDGGWTARLR